VRRREFTDVPALLQSQAYVVDLTEAYDQLAALIPRSDNEEPRPVHTIEIPKRTLSFSPVTAALADRLGGQARPVSWAAGKPSGYPNADLYQLLAYCTVLGLRAGHLTYANILLCACHLLEVHAQARGPQ
jgi:5-methylcytosine-specific restriction enzyme subunit McrC